jgi:exosortase
MRFLVATLAFGTLFCWLNFRSPSRILLFLSATVLVPIGANGVRAFGMVLVGHLYGMDSAVVVDHLVYGWGFFLVITLALMLVGLRFREPPRIRGAQTGTKACHWVWTAASAGMSVRPRRP